MGLHAGSTRDLTRAAVAYREIMAMLKRLAILPPLLLLLGGCARQAAAPAPQPANAKAAKADDTSEWLIETGPKDAKVEIIAFYPMNEDHAWVKALNQRLVDSFPGKVRVKQIDWWSEEGGKILKQMSKKQCAMYMVAGKPVVEKTPALGGWKEEKLIGAVSQAVERAYGKGAGTPKQLPPDPATQPKEGAQ